MYGIKAAVRRLDFAPDIKDMEVTDVTSGKFVFKPRPGKRVSLAALEKAVTDAGYEIEKTSIRVTGTLTGDGRLRVSETGQVFRLTGGKAPADSGASTVTGGWKAENGEQVVVLGEEQP